MIPAASAHLMHRVRVKVRGGVRVGVIGLGLEIG